jgi:aminopeptidase N
MRISVAVPNGLTDVSNGKFLGKTDLGDGYTRFDWLVQYPINNYNVAVNIGAYEHYSDRLGGLALDFYALPENLSKARVQYDQAKEMIRAFEHYLGEYPFQKDGYKLVEVPYSGMEHQSAVAYGNRFANGYLERDWTGVGISPRFDFIIIHESGHEWFGNSVTAADRSDMWIHEGFTTYLEALYVEYRWGKEDALKYLRGYHGKVKNQQAILRPRGQNQEPPGDQYFKGALLLNNLRSVTGDDKKWFAALRGFYQKYKYQSILTEEVVRHFNQALGQDLTPVFDQYLKYPELPVLELRFAPGKVEYRWKADAPGFNMPVTVGRPGEWRRINPSAGWQTLETSLDAASFDIDRNSYYVNVIRGTLP